MVSAPAHVIESIATKQAVTRGAQVIINSLEKQIQELGAGIGAFDDYIHVVKTFLASNRKAPSDLHEIAAGKRKFDRYCQPHWQNAETTNLILSYSAIISNTASSVIEKMPRHRDNVYTQLEEIGLANQQDQSALVENYIEQGKAAFKKLAAHRT